MAKYRQTVDMWSKDHYIDAVKINASIRRGNINYVVWHSFVKKGHITYVYPDMVEKIKQDFISKMLFSQQAFFLLNDEDAIGIDIKDICRYVAKNYSKTNKWSWWIKWHNADLFSSFEHPVVDLLFHRTILEYYEIIIKYVALRINDLTIDEIVNKDDWVIQTIIDIIDHIDGLDRDDIVVHIKSKDISNLLYSRG